MISAYRDWTPSMQRYPSIWNAQDVLGMRYVCGYCGTDTHPSKGWTITKNNQNRHGWVLICTDCNYPSFLDWDSKSNEILSITPAAKMGLPVAGLPNDVAGLYDVARACTGAGAYTAAVLVCRKILMHIAVEKGAKPGAKFIDYLSTLQTVVTYRRMESRG